MLLCEKDTWVNSYLKQYGYSIEKQGNQIYIKDSYKYVPLKTGEKVELYGGICPIVLEGLVSSKEKVQWNILLYEMGKKVKISFFEEDHLQISVQEEKRHIGLDLSLDHIELLEGDALKNRTLVYENNQYLEKQPIHLQAQYMDSEEIYGVFHNCFFSEKNDNIEQRYDYIENHTSTNEKKHISISDLDSLSFFVSSVLSKEVSLSLFRDIIGEIMSAFSGIEEYLQSAFPIFKELYQKIYMKQK